MLGGQMGCRLSVAFSPEGERIVSGSKEGAVTVWDVPQSLPPTTP